MKRSIWVNSLGLAFLLLMSSASLAADDVGFGYISILKVGSQHTDTISVNFEEGYNSDRRDCEGHVFIRASDMSQMRFEIIASVLLNAYTEHRKIRLHSHLDEGCFATFVTLGETLEHNPHAP